MQQVMDDGGADYGVVDDVGVVEANDVCSRKIDGVLRVVEHPAQRAGARPLAQSGVDGVVTVVGQRFLQVGNAAQMQRGVQHGAHGLQHVFFFAGAVVGFAGQQAQQVDQVLRVGFGRLALQGVEAGGLTVFQRQIVAAAGTHKDLGATVLVEEEDGGLGVELLRLRQQEVDQRCLAGARFADHQRVADGFFSEAVFAWMGGVEVEVVRLAVGGLQHGHAIAPGVLAALAAGEVVQWAQAQEVER